MNSFRFLCVRLKCLQCWREIELEEYLINCFSFVVVGIIDFKANYTFKRCLKSKHCRQITFCVIMLKIKQYSQFNLLYSLQKLPRGTNLQQQSISRLEWMFTENQPNQKKQKTCRIGWLPHVFVSKKLEKNTKFPSVKLITRFTWAIFL